MFGMRRSLTLGPGRNGRQTEMRCEPRESLPMHDGALRKCCGEIGRSFAMLPMREAQSPWTRAGGIRDEKMNITINGIHTHLFRLSLAFGSVVIGHASRATAENERLHVNVASPFPPAREGECFCGGGGSVGGVGFGDGGGVVRCCRSMQEVRCM